VCLEDVEVVDVVLRVVVEVVKREEVKRDEEEVRVEETALVSTLCVPKPWWTSWVASGVYEDVE